MGNVAQLTRTAFQTSRLLEFFTEKELQMQIGHPMHRWPLALLKELIDNALDACESANVLPEIEVTIDDDALSVRDNGPGLPVHVLERSLDYLVRVSDKTYYVSPTRGQLGNALKCVWAAPYVVTGEAPHDQATTRRARRPARRPGRAQPTALPGLRQARTDAHHATGRPDTKVCNLHKERKVKT